MIVRLGFDIGFGHVDRERTNQWRSTSLCGEPADEERVAAEIELEQRAPPFDVRKGLALPI